MENPNTHCYLCNATCITRSSEGASEIFDCPYCGVYQFSYNAKSILDNSHQEEKHIIAGFLGEINKGNHNNPYTLFSESINKIVSDVRIPKTIIQKLEKFLVYCYMQCKFIGQEFAISQLGLSNPYGTQRELIFGDSNRSNVSYIKITELPGVIKAMQELGWLNISANNVNTIISFSITVRGLERAEHILQGNTNSNKVFVAIEYHDDYEERLESAIKPACADCGFDAFIASDTQHNNDINDEMIVDIKRSKFIISDLTHNNEGAYYEAGFAEGMGLPVIKCCQEDFINEIHFDVNHDKFVVYTDLNDFRDQLKQRIRATIAGANLEDS